MGGWFGSVLHDVVDPGGLLSGAEARAGGWLDDGAHALGGALSDVGLGGAGQWVDQTGNDVANFLGAQVPEEQLGQTTNPAELIHGDPAALRSTASRLREFSSAFGETAAGLGGIDTGHWTGAAADAFRAKYAPQPGKWRDASAGCGDGADALESFANAVQWAQGQARQAVDLYESGQQATAAATAAYNGQVAAYNQAAQTYDSALSAGRNPGPRPVEPGPFTDPGAAMRERAQRILAAARQERDEAGARAAAKVSAATDLAPAEPSFGQQLINDLSDTVQASQLADTSFSAGVLDGVANIVKVARALNPMDPWNVTHLAEYTEGLSATAAGLVNDDLHPMDAVKGLVGTGWGSDPAQAAGELLPNLALAALTDGTGTADAAANGITEQTVIDGSENAVARLPEALTDPEDASRPLQDMTTGADPVDVASGDVVLAQTDVRLPGALSLVISRAHRSSYRAGRWFGRSWASTLDQRLEVTEQGVFFAAADTVVLCYPHPGENGEPVLPLAGARRPLAGQPGGGYTVTDTQAGLVWRFEPRSGYYLSSDGHGELPLVSVTDRAGHQIAVSYALDGTPQVIAHDGGYRVLVQVTGSRVTGLDLAAAGADGADVPLTRYSYDARGNLAEIVNSSGRPQRLSYDDAGRLTGWEDRNGWSYRYRYDDQGRCVRGEGPGGALSDTFGYDPVNRVTTQTDETGAVTVYQLTDRWQVATVTDPLGNTTRAEHDPFGRLISLTDRLGRTTTWSYDDAGNLAAITRPDGSRATATYDERNLPVAVTDPGGGTWQQEFDPSGNLVRLVGPDGAATSYGYDDRGHLASITGPSGAVTTVKCDVAGLPVAVTGPDGALARYARDAFGRVTKIAGADGSVSSLSWTTEGKLASRTFPDGSAERCTYDGEGNLVAHVSPAAGLTKLAYGCFDQVAARTGPDGTRTEFSYDHALRLTEVRHGGLAWSYEYDLAGRLAAETDYNGATTRYAHDGAGQLVSQVNAAGQHVSYGYDVLGNLTERRADGAAARFGYNEAGLLVWASNDDAEIRLERDAAGRVIAETCNGRTVRSVYDAAGRRVLRITPSGAETSWVFDEAGRPVTLHAAGQSIGFGYDPAGHETVRDLPGGVRMAQEWDPAGRLASQLLSSRAAVLSQPGTAAARLAQSGTSSPGRVLQRRGYSYRADGGLAGLDDLLSGSRQFSLDAAGRVTGVAGADWAEQYAYDPAGNVTTASWPTPPAGLAAPWAGSDAQGPREYTGTLISRAGGIRYRHDAQGRVTSRQQVRLSRKPDTWQYTWDADNRLTAVTTPDRTTWRYRYDPLGRRIAKQRLAPAGHVIEQTVFTWDGPTLAEQITLPAEPAPAWLHVVPASDAGTAEPGLITTWDYRPGTFTPLSQTERRTLASTPQDQVDERFYAIVTDLIGAPAELVGQDGTLAGYQQRTLWGTTLWHPDGAATPLRFPGQYHDPETGLHYNHHRYYDPVAGRYLTPDPLGLAPAPNPHTYVPNPTTHIDPLGLMDPCESPVNLANPEQVNLASPERTTHILYGDATGGGHLWPGLPGKTPFPSDWSAMQVMHAISEVVTSPFSTWTPQGARFLITGEFSGVDIRVIYDPRTDEIITAHPTNLPRNP
jgi:RHS repeat-associated protein